MRRRDLSLSEIATELAAYEEELAEFGLPTEMESVARARRWLDLDGDVELFAQAASLRDHFMSTRGTADVAGWAEVGGLWRLAGDVERARFFVERALSYELDWQPYPRSMVGAWYVMGDFSRAVALAGGGLYGVCARAALSGDASGIEGARAGLVRDVMVTLGGPQFARVANPLARWDWIEESFLLEARLTGAAVPSRVEMLERCGVLRDGQASAPPERPPLQVGTRVVHDGWWLEVRDAATAMARVEDELFVGFRREEGRWGAYETSDELTSPEWLFDRAKPSFQDAADEVADLLEVRGKRVAAERLRALISRYDEEVGGMEDA